MTEPDPDGWRDIRTIPPRQTVEVLTARGLRRAARLAYPDSPPWYRRRSKSVLCWDVHGGSGLAAVKWRPPPKR